MSYCGEQDDVGCVENKPDEGVGRLKCSYLITKKSYCCSYI
jgi:hypothetical protein